jgi:hypothetical protein
MTDGTRNIFMKIFSSLRKLIVAASLLLQLSPFGFHSHGAVGTAFTYNGRLAIGSNAANGSFDLQFRLRDAVIAGSLVGTANTLAPVAVSNGLFTVILDFGGTAFTGDARWLEIGVRTNGSADAYITYHAEPAATLAAIALRDLCRERRHCVERPERLGRPQPEQSQGQRHSPGRRERHHHPQWKHADPGVRRIEWQHLGREQQ